jgi:orotate phosphoribosyltransferase
VDAIREAGAEVIGLGAVFTYGFSKADEAFNFAGCEFFSLSNYLVLLQIAAEKNYITHQQHQTLLNWYQNPEVWFSNNI